MKRELLLILGLFLTASAAQGMEQTDPDPDRRLTNEFEHLYFPSRQENEGQEEGSSALTAALGLLAVSIEHFTTTDEDRLIKQFQEALSNHNLREASRIVDALPEDSHIKIDNARVSLLRYLVELSLWFEERTKSVPASQRLRLWATSFIGAVTLVLGGEASAASGSQLAGSPSVLAGVVAIPLLTWIFYYIQYSLETKNFTVENLSAIHAMVNSIVDRIMRNEKEEKIDPNTRDLIQQLCQELSESSLVRDALGDLCN